MRDARRDQTRLEITRLQTVLEKWIKRREEKDVDGKGERRYQYDSQLNAINLAVSTAAGVLRAGLDNLNLDALPLGEAYAKCSQYDQLVQWLWRVFDFFREKFDQRDDPDLYETLRAADDVLWSCYKPFFQKSRAASLLGPPPLPYVEGEYSPLAIRKNQKPASLAMKIKFEPLAKLLDDMPVDLMRLPTSTVSAPWSLTLVGHETGHFVQHAVEPGHPKLFAEALCGAVAAAGGDDDDEADWNAWAPEVFADWYSVLLMGPWAVWVMAQFELKGAEAMMAPRKSYPAPVVRLKLLSALCDHYAPAASAASAARLGLEAEFAAAAKGAAKDFKFVDQLRDAITSWPLPNELGLLTELVGFRPEEFHLDDDPQWAGEVSQWAGALRLRQQKKDDRQLRSARLIAAGAAQAWSEVMTIDDEEARLKAAGELNRNALERIYRNGEMGKRDAALRSSRGVAVRQEAKGLGEEIGKLLIEAGPPPLEDE